MVRACQKSGKCKGKAAKVAKNISPEDASEFAKKTEHFSEGFREWLQKEHGVWMTASPDDYQPHGLASQPSLGTGRPADPGNPNKESSFPGAPIRKKKRKAHPEDDLPGLADIGNPPKSMR